MPILQILAPDVSPDEEAEGRSEHQAGFCKIEIAATEESLKKLLIQEETGSGKEMVTTLVIILDKKS